MSTNEASEEASSAPAEADEAAGNVDGAPAMEAEDASDALESADVLSPAVRRLVRQYDLDITGVHGTGPDGRIRVSDVIGMLGGRGGPLDRNDDSARTLPPTDEQMASPATDEPREAPGRAPAPRNVVSTVFECDLGRVLAHRQRRNEGDAEPLLTSYFLVAFESALREAPQLSPTGPACFGVELTIPDGNVNRSLADAGALPTDAAPNERLRFFDGFLRSNAGVDLSAATLVVHNYGAGGSLLASPLPLTPGHAASLGIGRVRREIAVRGGDREETPRLVSLCYVSLSFDPTQIALAQANRFLARTVQTLELWPE
jgi:2-oxoglutarate dehydrogenase E2 component (dihydrolipoamide succinyltransferase)